MDIESQIKARNEEILQAEEDGNGKALERLLAIDFTIIRATGVRQDREAYLGAVPENAQRGRSADQVNVRLLGDGAIFTCVVTTTQNPDGTRNHGRFWNTRLFIKENDEWRCLSWQVTKIIPPNS